MPIPYRTRQVNCYLLLGDPLTLVDPGPCWAPTLTALETALAAQGVALSNIELLVLTHQHDDHTGLAATIAERSGCTVAAHELVAAVLEDEPRSRVEEWRYSADLLRLHGADEATLSNAVVPDAPTFARSVSVDRRLSDGDVITAGSRDLVVRLRPGHSPSDTVLLGIDGTALVGDHLLAPKPPMPLAHRPAAGSGDPRARPRALLDYRRSLRATRQDALSVAHPGHGSAIADPEVMIAAHLESHERRAARLLATLGAAPTTAWQTALAGRYGRPAPTGPHPIPIELAWLSDVLGQLDLLVADGRVAELDDGDIVRFVPTRAQVAANSSRNSTSRCTASNANPG